MLWIRVAAVLGFLGVALGAFGAHALKERLEGFGLDAYKTGVLYHLVHAPVVLALGAMDRGSVDLAAGLLTGGVVLFSGSLYAMAITRVRKLGIVTPFGGLCMLGGWVVVAVS
jgi:uncharacterized membrane protein YgdD (TMEM256/DUF423 family)